MPKRVSAPLLVIWSELELPLSVVSATPSAAGAWVSRVKLKLVALGEDIAGHIGLANQNGVRALDRRGRIAPARAVVD